MLYPMLVSALIAAGATQTAAPQRGAAPERRGSARVVIGRVQSVQASQQLLTVSARRGAEPRAVRVGAQTEFVRQVKSGIGDLKVGDVLVVTGVPLQLDARSIEVADPAGPSRGPVRPSRPGGAASRMESARSSIAANARVEGKVTRLDPLTLELPGGVAVEVKTDARTTVTRLAKSSLADIKVGEPVVVFGAPGAGGAMQASRVQVGGTGRP